VPGSQQPTAGPRVGVDVKVGADSSKFPVAGGEASSPFEVLEEIHRRGLDGVLFRSILDVSPTLDGGLLKEVRARADELELYLELGIGKVNPFASPETPHIRALGDGDYRLAMERMINAAADIGVGNLWSAMANYKPDLPGRFRYDRFRTDVTWDDQIAATVKFLRVLAPVLRDHGASINVETHEEVTSYELVRIVEDVGPDVVGITFDTANVVVRGEDPVAAARRVAPYTRMTHVRDVALFFVESGFVRLLAPCGQGIIDWGSLLSILQSSAPAPNLSIEGVLRSRAEMPVPVYEPEWQDGHPDLSVREVIELVRLARRHEAAVASDIWPSLSQSRRPLPPGEPLRFIEESARFLRAQLARTSPQDGQETAQ
jgi:sugar phosphate isomerase/epimerase